MPSNSTGPPGTDERSDRTTRTHLHYSHTSPESGSDLIHALHLELIPPPPHPTMPALLLKHALWNRHEPTPPDLAFLLLPLHLFDLPTPLSFCRFLFAWAQVVYLSLFPPPFFQSTPSATCLTPFLGRRCYRCSFFLLSLLLSRSLWTSSGVTFSPTLLAISLVRNPVSRACFSFAVPFHSLVQRHATFP